MTDFDSLLTAQAEIKAILAYIDPGSGSAILSAIIGAIVAISLTIKTYWYKLKSFFSRKGNDTEDVSSIKDHPKNLN